MKKNLFYLSLLFLPVLGFGQWTVNFEDGTFPPEGWSVESTNENETWELDESGQANGTNVAWVNYDSNVELQDERLISATSDLSAIEDPILKFVSFASYSWSVNPNDNSDMTLEISTDGGATWTALWSEDDLGNFGEFQPISVQIDLADYATETAVNFSWRYVGLDGAAWYIDNLVLEGANSNPTPENGCLDAPGGVYPSGVFVPSCQGVSQDVANGLGYTGEYSLVQVTAGTEYIFSLSNPEYFITIGNEQGTEVLAYGPGSVTWTPDSDQVIRFYSHLDEDCNYDNETYHSRIVKCGEIPAYDPCNPIHLGDTLTGAGITGDIVAANDLNVLAGTQFTVQTITFDITTEGGEGPTSFDVSFYDGETGIGELYGETFVGLTPTSVTENGIISGIFPIYTIELTLPSPVVLPATETEDARYWVAINSGMDSNGGYIYWRAFEYNDTNTLPTWRSYDGGATWEEFHYTMTGESVEGVMSIEGECGELLVTNDLNSFDFSYYPNPVKDVLNISSKKSVENVSVFNLAGQKVLNHAKVSNNQVDVSALASGTYVFKVTLEGGQIETFKIIKK